MLEENSSAEERVKCDIEIDCTNGKAVAWVLRDLADKIGQESLDSGWHDVKVPNGDKVGELYLDFYETSNF